MAARPSAVSSVLAVGVDADVHAPRSAMMELLDAAAGWLGWPARAARVANTDDAAELRERVEQLQAELRAAADPDYAARKLAAVSAERNALMRELEELRWAREKAETVRRNATAPEQPAVHGKSFHPEQFSRIELPPIHRMDFLMHRIQEEAAEKDLAKATAVAEARRARELEAWDWERELQCAKARAAARQKNPSAESRRAELLELCRAVGRGDPRLLRIIARTTGADLGLISSRERVLGAVHDWRRGLERERIYMESARLVLRGGKFVGVEVVTYPDGARVVTRVDRGLVESRLWWEVEFAADRRGGEQ